MPEPTWNVITENNGIEVILKSILANQPSPNKIKVPNEVIQLYIGYLLEKIEKNTRGKD